MNENLNLVKILKDCPEGTKLYSPIYGDVELVEVIQVENIIHPHRIKPKRGYTIPHTSRIIPHKNQIKQ